MKTLNFIKSKITLSVLYVAVGFLVVSCGSYSNSSYYDNDGIYSGSNTAQRVELPEVTENQVAESRYFSQFQDDDYFQETDEPIGIFTDVDAYYGDESYSGGYAGWGNETSNINVNVYGGSYWGWNGWYGSYWGWRPYWGWSSWYYPSYYWSWNWGIGWNYGWYSPYYYGGYYPYYGYYYNNQAAYSGGPRNTYGTRSDYRGSTRNAAVNSSRSAYEVRGRNNQINNNTRSSTRFSTRNSTLNQGSRNSTLNNNTRSNSNTRGTINTGRNTNINQNSNSRGTINNSRTTDPNRNRTINSNSGSNRGSSYGSGSSGGSRSSGGSSGGGGRSSGGGGRR
ncbi:MAG: hypothetical protein WCY89_03110 [Flavobacteriaceae bacterium]